MKMKRLPRGRQPQRRAARCCRPSRSPPGHPPARHHRAAYRSMLQQILQHMAVIYGPPSDSRHRFAARRKSESETPLAFRSALLALAKTAFPRMDLEGIDALVLEKLLSLAREMRVVIHVVDDEDFCSLCAARCIQAHLLLQKETSLVACAAPADACSSEEESQHNQAFASTPARGWRADDRRHQRDI
ncbi:unnamed protein product [Lampetra fluviatilis]